MTRRERLEARLARRREWAEGRRAKAEQLLERNKPFEGDWAFSTQPGHIPERARAIARSDRAYEHEKVARHHDSKGDGLERALEKTIFSDDPDALEALEAKAKSIDAQVDWMKRVNAAYRKAKGAPGWAKGIVTKGLGITDEQALDIEAKAAKLFRLASWERQPHPAYQLTNARANARRLRARAQEIIERNRRAALAENYGGLWVKADGGYASVTFAEKPSQAVLDAMHRSHWNYHQGTWSGRIDALVQTCTDELWSKLLQDITNATRPASEAV